MACTQRQHRQPVETERDAARVGHGGERNQEILVDRIAHAIKPLLGVHFGNEAPALFGGVGQFAEAIGEFDPAGVQFEAFGKARIVVAGPGERGFGERVARQQRQPAMAEVRLDAGDDDLAEQVGPAIFGSNGNAEPGDGGSECIAIVQNRRQGDAGVAVEGFHQRQYLGLRKGIARHPAPMQRVIAAGDERGAAQGDAVGHDVGIGRVGAIPFDHGKFGRVQRARLAIAPHPGEIDNTGFTGGKQFLGGEFG